MFRISPDGSTLTVTGAHTTDSGKYTCVATNTAGEEDRIFNLNVYGGFNAFFTFHVSSSAKTLSPLSLVMAWRVCFHVTDFAFHYVFFSASCYRRQQWDSWAADHSSGQFCQHWVCCYRLSSTAAQLAEKWPSSASVLPHTASFCWTGAPVGQWTGFKKSL